MNTQHPGQRKFLVGLDQAAVERRVAQVERERRLWDEVKAVFENGKQFDRRMIGVTGQMTTVLVRRWGRAELRVLPSMTMMIAYHEGSRYLSAESHRLYFRFSPIIFAGEPAYREIAGEMARQYLLSDGDPNV